MNNKKVFEFDDYKVYLVHIEKIRAPIQKGFRSRLAEEIGCQSAFISQVFNSGANFSLEQALKISNYLKHSSEEKKYFLLLVELVRAGSRELKEFFESQKIELRSKYLNIDSRIFAEKVPQEANTTYYSQWYYSAVHIICSIPKYQTVAEAAKALGLPKGVVERAVMFLLSCGLLTQKNGNLSIGSSQLHLTKTSPEVQKHHTNFRIQAIKALEKTEANNLHYSTVSSLSKDHVQELRSKFLNDIEQYLEGVQNSAEETLYCFNLDFFSLIEE